jgi:peptide deformylase
MALTIVQFGDPILRKKGKPVTEFGAKLAALAMDMVEAMDEAHGIGLAAQQVGRAIQLCVIDLRGTETPSTWIIDGSSPPLDLVMPMALVNPVVELTPEPATSYEEGCLSFPGINGEVVRPDRAMVRFQDPDGHPHEMVCTGLLSRCVQHEADHLQGILFIDRMSKQVLASLAEPLAAFKGRGRRP